MVIYFAYNLIILVNVKRSQIAFTAEYRHRHLYLYLYIENKVKGMKEEKESIFIYKYAYFCCYEYH